MSRQGNKSIGISSKGMVNKILAWGWTPLLSCLRAWAAQNSMGIPSAPLRSETTRLLVAWKWCRHCGFCAGRIMSFWKHRGLNFYTVFAILHCGARFFSWLSTVQDMHDFWLSDECFILYHTHHITVHTKHVCQDRAMMIAYIFSISTGQNLSNAWFWALHWHLPKAKISASCAGTIEDGTGVPGGFHWAEAVGRGKNPVRSLRSLLGYSCTAMHCNLEEYILSLESNKSTFCNQGDEYLTGN